MDFHGRRSEKPRAASILDWTLGPAIARRAEPVFWRRWFDWKACEAG